MTQQRFCFSRNLSHVYSKTDYYILLNGFRSINEDLIISLFIIITLFGFLFPSWQKKHKKNIKKRKRVIELGTIHMENVYPALSSEMLGEFECLVSGTFG